MTDQPARPGRNPFATNVQPPAARVPSLTKMQRELFDEMGVRSTKGDVYAVVAGWLDKLDDERMEACRESHKWYAEYARGNEIGDKLMQARSRMHLAWRSARRSRRRQREKALERELHLLRMVEKLVIERDQARREATR